MALGNLDGLLVTVPYKARMLPLRRRAWARRRDAIGAVNALRREADGSWTGDMFDGAGFVRGAKRKGERLARPPRRAVRRRRRGQRDRVRAGGGRASQSIAHHRSGRARQGRSARRAAVAARSRRATSRRRRDVPRGVDMIVNASTVGMRAGDGLPGDIGALDADTLVGDVVDRGRAHALIRHAMRVRLPLRRRPRHACGQVDAMMAFFAAARPSRRRAGRVI